MPEHCMYCGSQTGCDCRDHEPPRKYPGEPACPKCGDVGYVHDARSGRRIPCDGCWPDNGPEAPKP